jgi:hypothetical protein
MTRTRNRISRKYSKYFLARLKQFGNREFACKCTLDLMKADQYEGYMCVYDVLADQTQRLEWLENGIENPAETPETGNRVIEQI